MSDITSMPIKRLLKRAGAKRVSNKAASTLAEFLEEKTKDLAQEANKISKHSGRKTVMKHDIKLAKKIISK